MSVAPRASAQRASVPRQSRDTHVPDAERRLPPPRSRAALRPVPSPRRAQRRPLAFYAFASLVLVAMVLGLTALNAIVAQGSFRVADLSRRVDKLTQQHQDRTLAVARLSAPERIAREARALGLRPHPSAHVIRVPAGSKQRSRPAESTGWLQGAAEGSG